MENSLNEINTIMPTKPDPDQSGCENTAAGCVTAQNTADQSRSFLERSVTIKLGNGLEKTEKKLYLVDYRVTLGRWITKPPHVIEYGKLVEFTTMSSDYFSGTSGWAKYKIDGLEKEFLCKWENPYIGWNNYDFTPPDENYLFENCGGGKGTDSFVTWYIKEC